MSCHIVYSLYLFYENTGLSYSRSVSIAASCFILLSLRGLYKTITCHIYLPDAILFS